MADEKEKKDGEEAPAKSGGGMMPLILVAVGAVLGGAGTTMLTGGGGESAHAPPPTPTFLIDHPDAIKAEFHPRTQGGPTRLAICEFKFAYTTSAYDPRPAADAHAGGNHGYGGGGGAKGPTLKPAERAFLGAMQLRWDPMRAQVLKVFESYTEPELNDLSRRDEIERRLMVTMTDALYPEGNARVSRIYILKLLIQK